MGHGHLALCGSATVGLNLSGVSVHGTRLVSEMRSRRRIAPGLDQPQFKGRLVRTQTYGSGSIGAADSIFSVTGSV